MKALIVLVALIVASCASSEDKYWGRVAHEAGQRINSPDR